MPRVLHLRVSRLSWCLPTQPEQRKTRQAAPRVWQDRGASSGQPEQWPEPPPRLPQQDFETNDELRGKVVSFLEEVMHDPELLTQERKAAANIIRSEQPRPPDTATAWGPALSPHCWPGAGSQGASLQVGWPQAGVWVSGGPEPPEDCAPRFCGRAPGRHLYVLPPLGPGPPSGRSCTCPPTPAQPPAPVWSRCPWCSRQPPRAVKS